MKRSKLVSFKVEAELAELLNAMPNKSAFIRKAVLEHADTICPLCNGQGEVVPGIAEHFAPLLTDHRACACAACGIQVAVPFHLADWPEADWPRLKLFLGGGPFFCEPCYQSNASAGLPEHEGTEDNP